MITPYPNQQIIIDELQADSDIEVFGVDAPTGSGKSILAMYSAKGLGGGYGTTPQRVLVDQYARLIKAGEFGNDMGWTVMGRGAYPCEYLRTKEKPVEDATADGAPCTTKKAVYDYKGYHGRRCPLIDICEYYADVRKAKKSLTAVSTFHYFMYGIVNKIEDGNEDVDDQSWRRRPVLIIDEAHNLPSIFADFYKIEVTKRSFPGFQYDLLYDKVKPLGSEKALEALQVFNVMFDTYFAEQQNTLELMEEVFSGYRERVETGDSDTTLQDLEGRFVDEAEFEKKLVKMRKLIYRLTFIKTSMEREDVEWLFHMDENGMYWKPYSPAPFLENVWSHFSKIIFMSATLFNFPLFLKMLGLDKRKNKFLHMPSTFDPKNSKLHFEGNTALNRDNFEQTLPDVVKMVEQVARKHSTESGIIHCYTKAYQREIYARLSSDVKARVMIHDADDRMEKLVEFMHAPKGTIFLTRNMGEGVDLKDDMSRWQIVVKAPYASLGDPWVAAHWRRDKGWYETQTIIAILQMAGRIVRSKEDWGETYIIDRNAYSLLHRYWRMLPPWFTDRINAATNADMEELSI